MPVERKQQILAAVETSEGTAATLAGSDAIQVFDPQISTAVEVQDRSPAGPTLSRDSATVGRQTRQLTYRSDFRGSGSTGTAPEFAKLLLGSGFKQLNSTATALRTLTLGAVTGIGFQIGEIVNQTASNRGVVVGILSTTDVPKHRTVTTGDKLVVAVFLGTFGTAATTGESSGSTSTASAATSTAGFCYVPTSDKWTRLQVASWSGGTPVVGDVLKIEDTSAGGALIGTCQIARDNGSMLDFDVVVLHMQPGFNGTAANNRLRTPSGAGTATLSAAPSMSRTPSLTQRHNLDGRNRLLLGSRGDFNLAGDSGGPMQFEWTFTGDIGTDADAAPVATSGLSTVRPPRLLGAFLCYGNGSELYRIPTKRVSLAQGGQVTANLDGNRDGGATGSNVTDRDPRITVTVDNINGGFDWEAALKNGTVIRAAFLLGTALGNTVFITAPVCQVVECPLGNAEGISTFDVTLAARRIQESGDDELYLGQL